MKNEELKDKFKTFLDYLVVLTAKLMMVGIALSIIMGILIVNEVKGARDFCKSIDGDYNFRLIDYPNSHICNESPIFKYKTGWNYDIYNKNISLDDLGLN